MQCILYFNLLKNFVKSGDNRSIAEFWDVSIYTLCQPTPMFLKLLNSKISVKYCMYVCILSQLQTCKGHFRPPKRTSQTPWDPLSELLAYTMHVQYSFGWSLPYRCKSAAFVSSQVFPAERGEDMNVNTNCLQIHHQTVTIQNKCFNFTWSCNCGHNLIKRQQHILRISLTFPKTFPKSLCRGPTLQSLQYTDLRPV